MNCYSCGSDIGDALGLCVACKTARSGEREQQLEAHLTPQDNYVSRVREHKKILAGAMVCFLLAGVLPLLAEESGPFASLLSTAPPRVFGTETELKKENQTFMFDAEEQDVTLELRVFGYNLSDFSKYTVAQSIATHLFMAAPMKEAGEIYDKNFCEKDAMALSSIMFIIADDAMEFANVEALRTKAGKGGRNCAKIVGKRLRLKKYLVNGAERKINDVAFGGEFKSDPNEMLRVKHIEGIECS